jgi:hypothetical protein
MSKVLVNTDKLTSATTFYRDALMFKPPHLNSTVADPRVLCSMDWRVKQILIDVLNKAEGNVLSISLTSILEKANEAIAAIMDIGKLADTKFVAALKT